MSRMKKSVAMFCAISCCAVMLASPASAHAPDNGGCRTRRQAFCLSRENFCLDRDALLQWLQKGCFNFSDLFPSFPEIVPPETDAPEDGGQTPPPAEEQPGEPDTPSIPDEPVKPDEPSEPDKPQTPGGSETDGLSAYEAQVVSLVNAERAAAGLSPLAVNIEATKAARIRCQEQTVSFSHTRPSGARFSSVLDELGISYLGAGENIAYGQRSADEVMKDWMNSPGHRANILREEYTEIGVGCFQDTTGILYWTQLFLY